MSSESWPPQLKDWVANCLGKMSDSNRAEAQAELRQVISDAFMNKTLWTTDWNGVQLQSLIANPAMSLNPLNNLKRKMQNSQDTTGPSKKTKKSQSHANKGYGSNSFDPNDQAALHRRAARFQREHEIERQKQNGGHASFSQSHPLQNTHFFTSRSHTPMNADEPEANNPNVPNWDRFTIVGTSQEIFKDYLRLTSEPKPEQIRPYHILQKTLEELKKRWREKANYSWICSQFKSLRQDLTVRRLVMTNIGMVTLLGSLGSTYQKRIHGNRVRDPCSYGFRSCAL